MECKVQGAYTYYYYLDYLLLPYSYTYSHYYLSIQCCILHQSEVLPLSITFEQFIYFQLKLWFSDYLMQGCHLCFVQTRDRRWSDKNSYASNSISIANVVLYLHWHISSAISNPSDNRDNIQRYKKCEIWDMDDVVQ